MALLWNQNDLAMSMRCTAAQAEAKKLGIVTQLLGVRAPNDFADAFREMDRHPPDAILLVADTLTVINHQAVFDYATAHHLPDMEELDLLAHIGGLMAYSIDQNEVFDRLAAQSDRILHGAKPADLPLELPNLFSFLDQSQDGPQPRPDDTRNNPASRRRSDRVKDGVSSDRFPRPHHSLFQKYFLVLFVAVVVPLIINGASDAWFGYRDQRANLSSRLRAEANSAAGQIQAFLDGIRAQMDWTVQLPWAEGLDDRHRFDALRLCARRRRSPK